MPDELSFDVCDRHPDCLFQGGCECKRQAFNERMRQSYNAETMRTRSRDTAPDEPGRASGPSGSPSAGVEPPTLDPTSAIGPSLTSDRDALAKLYLACINRMSPSERRDAGLTPLLDDIGRYLGVPDAAV